MKSRGIYETPAGHCSEATRGIESITLDRGRDAPKRPSWMPRYADADLIMVFGNSPERTMLQAAIGCLQTHVTGTLD